jgi:DNA polymerase III epsilon subunit-like protein
MTAGNTPLDAAAPRHDPHDLPVYGPGQAPAELLTARQLRAARLPVEGCAPSAWLGYGDGDGELAPLYEHAAVLEAMLTRDRAEATAWAAGVLADRTTVVLDTETTGLTEPRLVDIGVLGIDGEVLLDTLVNPGVPIPAEASAIHGITDADAATAPSFAAILPQLTNVLSARRVIIYNAGFDTRVLTAELDRYEHDLAPRAVRDIRDTAAHTWLDRLRVECAMLQHAKWFGAWHPYWRSYTWQPLEGGDHRALGDCRATVERLREMAAAPTRGGT